jgi:hypothetical protein
MEPRASADSGRAQGQHDKSLRRRYAALFGYAVQVTTSRRFFPGA